MRSSSSLRPLYQLSRRLADTGTTATIPINLKHIPNVIVETRSKKAADTISVDLGTYTTDFQACTNIKQLSQLHAQLIINGDQHNVSSGSKLVHRYIKCGDLENARLVFDKIAGPNVLTWNTMMRGHVNNGDHEETMEIYYRMAGVGVEPDKFTFPCVLKACAALLALEEGKEIHDDILRNGLESDAYVGSALVTMYAKCGSLENARDVFDKMSQRDVVSWNALIAGYVQNGQCEEALKGFREMQWEGVEPDEFTAASVLPAALERSKDIHGFIIRKGFDSDHFVGTVLIDTYTKCRDVEIARQVFDKMYQRNLTCWNAMIAGYAQNGLCNDALELFGQMEISGVKPNKVTLASVLLACSHVGTLQAGKEIHQYLIKRNFESDVFVGSALVAMYAKCEAVEDGRRVFDRMSQPEVALWNSMIAGYVQNGYFEEALKLFAQTKLLCIKYDFITICTILSACAHLGALQQGKEIHNYIVRNGFEANAHVGSALVTMYTRCKQVDDACNVFDGIHKKDVVSFCAIIAGLAQTGRSDKALENLRQMQIAGLKPDSDTIASVLSVCACLTALKQGKEIHNYIFQSGFESDVYVGTALVDMYAKCGSMELARQVFESMPRRNVVSWNAMITGYSQNGHSDAALKCFGDMQFEKVMIDSITIVGILPACASLAAIQHGKEVHACIYRREFYSDGFVGEALIDMYAKCGNIKVAHQVFDRMSQRGLVAWNIIIAAYGMHGHGQDALTLFYQMQRAGVLPDHITFIAVLSACSHAGLVDEGWKYFDCMTHHYCVTPTMGHFACMVDLLGRSGYLDDAYDFIRKMPLEPDAMVWGALLGACRIHCNADLGEIAAKQLFALEPDHVGYYVLLSNIYAGAGRWDDAARVRTMMKDKGLKKTPGWSWIKVDSRVHVFTVGDRSHPESEKIYAILKSLCGQMKEAGYVPDTRFVLHNVEEEYDEERIHICNHSEKMVTS